MNVIFSPSEVVTRLSEVCCKQVVDDGALPVIFKVLKKCNRSLPHLEVIKYSVLILYNVVKVGKFVFVMFSYFPSSQSTILELKKCLQTSSHLLKRFLLLANILL